METVSLNKLLKIMDSKTYRLLKLRGVIKMARTAPDAQVLLSSLPAKYRLQVV